jgi:hypothetical protein
MEQNPNQWMVMGAFLCPENNKKIEPKQAIDD